jgi:CRISPR/Cas system-associated exonuclease Cas4 (RecB family)
MSWDLKKENGKLSEGSLISQSSNLIYEYENFLLKNGLESDKHRKHDHFHPSAFGSCLRKIAFQYYEIPKDYTTEPRAYRIFEAGHAHHHRMQKHFAQMGILRGYWKCNICGKVYGKENKIGIFCPEDCDCKSNLDSSFNLNRKGLDLFEYEEILLKDDEHNFKGHCDGIIELVKNEPDERYVVDFKTVKAEKFAILKDPDPVYIVQINIYMWLSGVKKSIIFYEEKNTHELKEFHLRYDAERIEDIKTNALKLKKVLAARQLPSIPKTFEKRSKPCVYCEFREKCWKMSK